MAREMPSNLVRKAADYAILAVGTNALVDGIVRVVNNPPEYISDLDSQIAFGRAGILIGTVAIAYGIERIVRNQED